MRLVLCAFVASLLASMTLAGCSDDDYKSGGTVDGSATSTDAGDLAVATGDLAL